MLKTRFFKFKINILSVFLLFFFAGNAYSQKEIKKSVNKSDREYWVDLLYKTATPVLENMSKGTLRTNMPMEVSPSWQNQTSEVGYMEAFGRLMAGVAPWLNLHDDDSPEGRKRKQIREWSLRSYANAVDPENPDYLHWSNNPQPLVDAAYIAQSFMRAPQALWEPLDSITKQRYIKEFKGLVAVKPAYNNWLLFRAVIEGFFLSINEEYDRYVLEVAIRKMNEWYLGDGWYADGPEFSLDYYNGYVMHPMLVETLEVMTQHNVKDIPLSFDLALRRMQRYNQLIERLISPEASYPAVGRSMTYRMGAFQTLALSAWKYKLPETQTNGQIRNALTSVMKRIFVNEDNFDKNGFLQLGFVGYQPDIADYYTNTGSLYITSLVFLPLGLPQDHDFWTSNPEEWTSQKAWSGKPFLKDYHESVKN